MIGGELFFQMNLGFVCREVMEGLEYGGDAMRGIAGTVL